MAADKNWGEAPEVQAKPLQRHEIAMRYLARNPDFQADYVKALEDVRRGSFTIDDATSRLIRIWGLSYPADPDAPHDMSRIHVQPVLSPVTVQLTASDISSPSDTCFTSDKLKQMHHCLQCDGLSHVILADEAGDIRLCLTPECEYPLALHLPLDGNLHIRLASAERLRRHILGLAAGPPPLLLTSLQQSHLLIMLRAWDGRMDGVRARELATVLIDPDVDAYSAALWSDSRQRRQIGRWLSDAESLISGGYLRLLRGDDRRR